MVKDAHNVTVLRTGRVMDKLFVGLAKIKADVVACNLRLLEPVKVASSHDKSDRLKLESKNVRLPQTRTGERLRLAECGPLLTLAAARRAVAASARHVSRNS